MNNNESFVEYYKNTSLTDKAKNRAEGIMDSVIRLRKQTKLSYENLTVADIGCNSGTQSRCWLEKGHTVHGIDISSKLIEIAIERTKEFYQNSKFEVCNATKLPWQDNSFDVCILPELIEHIQDWEKCLEETIRVIKPGGTLFLSTTNILCPKQQEFDLPFYSWYPTRIKRHFVKKSLTTSPQLVNHTNFPALHWFSPYRLKKFFIERRCLTYDRFDLINEEKLSPINKALIHLIRKIKALRFSAHTLTPYTILIAQKPYF